MHVVLCFPCFVTPSVKQVISPPDVEGPGRPMAALGRGNLTAQGFLGSIQTPELKLTGTNRGRILRSVFLLR